MMRSIVYLVLSMLMLIPAADTQDGGPGPGIPLTLAQERAARVRDLRYDLSLSVPAAASDPVTGTVRVSFVLSDPSKPLALDFAGPAERLKSVSANGQPVNAPWRDEHILVPASALRPGTNELQLTFVAGDASLNRNPDFMYSLFVPARAHLAFPCFDQPDLKARWSLALDVPAGWQVLSNGAESERREDSGRLRVRFAETAPLSSYVFAFAAGKYLVETGERDGRTFRMFHRETDAAKVARNRDAIFDLHAASLKWLEAYTGIPYPWGKFDFLLVPSFQFGGMEHPGAIYYNASGLFLDPSATQNQKLGRASVIAHETTHMWFGDLVTMRWFNDVWMKEVFANFMAAKIVNPSFPEINHELRFLYAHYPGAYDVDRTAGTNAIRQPLANLDEAGSLYGAIIYQKAPIVMRQLERIVGDEKFRDGLRRYLDQNRFANATWADLISVLDPLTPEDLSTWSHAWVEEAGRPVIRTDLTVRDGRIASLAFTQRDPVEARGLTWNQQIEVLLGLADGPRHLEVRLRGARTEVPDAVGLPAPAFVLPTGGGIGYGGFELDRATTAYLLEHLPEIGDPLTRGAAWITLWEEMLDGRAAPSSVFALALRALPREADEQNLQRILGYAEQAFWRFLPERDRGAHAPELERVLRAGLDHASSASVKSAWFNALRDTATTPANLAWLQRVWNREETVPGLTLAEPDYIQLALELAVRQVPAWNEILTRQLERTENPDRKARFAFVRPALSPDQRVRDEFFASLADVNNRRREPWVLEGLSYLHHPLRAAASRKYIPKSLALLTEIQRTGDIFFPKRWMDATLGGHRSAEAAGVVRDFLSKLPPDYPDRLRRIIVSSADDLFRASALAP